MTPLQIAKEECANWMNVHGQCAKIVIQDDGTLVRRPSMPDFCNLGVKGQRCSYFEESVLPMGKKIENAKYKQEFLEGEHQYRMETGAMNELKTSKCACGRRREPKHQYCPLCAKSKRRESVAAANLKRRGHSTTNEPLESGKNKGFLGANSESPKLDTFLTKNDT